MRSLLLLFAFASAAPAVELKQVISREHPAFNIEKCQLTIGRDGKVYLFSSDYVLRIDRDGSGKRGAKVTYALMGAAANKEGTIATANAHFDHSVHMVGADFNEFGKVSDFLVNDKVEWQAPCDIQAGEKDFYALDQNRNRIVRVGVPDQLVTTYSLAGLGDDLTRKLAHFRVWEAGKRFYIWRPSGDISALGFDGKLAWSIKAGPLGNPWDGWAGGFDVDDEGRLYVVASAADTVRVFDAEGKPAGSFKLDLGPRKGRISDFRLWGDDVVIRRPHGVELFQVYDRKTGKLKRVVNADVEQLTVVFPSDIWTAGANLDLKLDFDPGAHKADPQWRAWLRPLGSVDFSSFSRLSKKGAGPDATTSDLELSIPKDAGGLYHLRICPDVSGAASEYMVESVVEIRQPDAKGCVSLFTPLNRYYFGRGESIPVHVRVRVKEATDLPARVKVFLKETKKTPRFVPAKGFKKDPTIRFEQDIDLKEGAASFVISKDALGSLEGQFAIDVEAPRFTVAQQIIEIGPGSFKKRKWGSRPLEHPEAPPDAKFSIVQHGDYNTSFPTGTLFDLPEKIDAHLARARYLGVNMFVDRLGHGPSVSIVAQKLTLGPIDRLKTDPLSPVPEKALFENNIKRTIAGYGAYGMEQRAILLYMDAGLPVGTGFDARKPEDFAKAITTVCQELADYPAFTGWSWAANWWLGKLGAEAAPTPEKKKQYLAALKKANETGAWDPVLDEVTDIMFSHAVNAEKEFRKTLEKFSPLSKKAAGPDAPSKDLIYTRKLLSVMTAPYRAVGAHPPCIFENADEIDLHYQAEQIQPPQVTPHHVDFYKRPGKRAWGHPELWNDDGSGGQIIPTTLQMFMRGADGIGFSGDPMDWRKPSADPRSFAAHIPSIHHELNKFLAEIGPWHTTLKCRDPIAIVVSTRMMRIDDWSKIGGRYFDRLYEAYNACLYAHRPASFVFAEDLKADTFKDFKAVLVVGQRVELDPPLATALAEAKKAGLLIFHDDTCRAELVNDFEPLKMAFDKVERDPSAWQDDAAYYRFPRHFKAHAANLKKTLGDRVPPVAKIDQPDVLVTERVDDKGNRFFWVVNNTPLDLEPGLAWRMGLIQNMRAPVTATIEIDTKGAALIDAMSRVRVSDGRVALDAGKPRLLEVSDPKKKEPFRGFPAILNPGRSAPLEIVENEGTFAVACAGWAQNLFLFNDGPALLGSAHVGHHFVFDVKPAGDGFAVVGFDLHSAAGYHLYLVNKKGAVLKRFPHFGLPGRLTSWANGSQFVESPPAFAVARDASWVASAGPLGMAVWDKDAALLWKREWWGESRKSPILLNMGDALIVLDGMTVSALASATGKSLWSHTLEGTGSLQGGAVSEDGVTLAVRSDSGGGAVFVVQRGGVVAVFPGAAERLALAPDGKTLAVAQGNELRYYDVARGLLWNKRFTAPVTQVLISDYARKSVVFLSTHTEFMMLEAADGKRVIERQSDIGFNRFALSRSSGRILLATPDGVVPVSIRPAGALTFKRPLDHASCWIPGWPSPPRFAPDATPTAPLPPFGNAAKDPAPLDKNLLRDTKALIYVTMSNQRKEWKNKIDLLIDGKPDAPPEPWLDWTTINYIDSGWYGPLELNVDTFRTQLRLTGVTFVEDPKHPESWLRDLKLQYWDAAKEQWRDGPMFLSNQATHTHWLKKPIEAARFRFVTTGPKTWPAGNIRLGELVFHGEVLGCSHPDAVAKKPVAILFDEKEDDLKSLNYPGRPFAFLYEGAFSGGKCLALKAAGNTGPAWQPPFGHAIPNWDFEIAEKPAPGQYRYLQFAWKALSKETKGMSLLLGRAWPGGGYNLFAGEHDWKEGVVASKKIADAPPSDWQIVTVDLWEMHKKPLRIQALSLAALGGGAAFDRIRLARSLEDLRGK